MSRRLEDGRILFLLATGGHAYRTGLESQTIPEEEDEYVSLHMLLSLSVREIGTRHKKN